MLDFFKSALGFLRKNPSILYSLALLFIIPAVLYYSNIYVIQSFQKIVDFNLRSQAMMAESIFGIFSADLISDSELLQSKVEEVIQENPELSQLRILKPEKEKEFKIIASNRPQEIGNSTTSPSLTLSWYQDQTISNRVRKNQTRFWTTCRPIYNSTGTKVALISMDLSLTPIDTLISKVIFRSYLIIIIGIGMTLFLIFQHTRLFSYVDLYRRLKEVDKMKDEFIRMAIHEVQSPIVNIRGYLQTLREEIEPLITKTQKEYFRRVQISSKSLSNLIYDILHVARIEQGRLDFTPQQISPQKELREIVKELEGKADRKGLQLRFKEKVEPYLISVQPHRFRQILTNLIDNAIKYTPKGKVEVRTFADETKRKYYIYVKDTGIGISAENQKKLFSKFYRVKTRETAEIAGTGLGLWIAKQLARKMKGDIFVESMKGVGSKFTVIFPLSKSRLVIK